MAAWRVVAASVRGTSHQRTELPCQDAFQYLELPTGELLVAVADGAGSASQAKQGSHIAVTTAIRTLEATLAKYRPASRKAWRGLVRQAFLAVHAALYTEASAAGLAARQYASTLILLILAKDEAICGLVGDCAGVIRDETDALVSLSPPQRGEYANSTNFVIEPHFLSVLDIAIWPTPICSAAIFSDGLTSLAMNLAQNKPHLPFFDPLFAFVRAAEDDEDATTQLAAFLDSPRVNARTDDDKTLVLVYRTGE